MRAVNLTAEDARMITVEKGVPYKQWATEYAAKRLKRQIKAAAKKGQGEITVLASVDYIKDADTHDLFRSLEDDGFRVYWCSMSVLCVAWL